MANNPLEFMKDVMAAPLGELISSIGQGVGEAQAALDKASIEQYLAIYNKDNKSELVTMLRSIGYQPTFYVLPETEVEAQVSLSLSVRETADPSLFGTQSKTKIYATPANATNNNQFNLDVNAFAKLKFKIVPVPPPTDIAELRVVPELIGQEWDDGLQVILADSDLEFTIISDKKSGKVISQSYEKGSYVKLGTVIEVRLE